MRLEPTTMLAPGRTVAALVTQHSASAPPRAVAIARGTNGEVRRASPRSGRLLQSLSAVAAVIVGVAVGASDGAGQRRAVGMR